MAVRNRTGTTATPLTGGSGIARDTGVRHTKARRKLGGAATAPVGQSRRSNASNVFETLQTMGFLSPGVNRNQVEHCIGLAITK